MYYRIYPHVDITTIQKLSNCSKLEQLEQLFQLEQLEQLEQSDDWNNQTIAYLGVMVVCSPNHPPHLNVTELVFSHSG
jgi:hypothetical protein